MPSVRRFILILFLAALPLTLAADKDSHAVSIKGMQYDPDTITIQVGQTVTWTNNDDRDHTVVSDKEAFKSDNLRPGATFSFQFAKAGTYSYGCAYHPRMKGVVIVSSK